jgi:hypothetical protein
MELKNKSFTCKEKVACPLLSQNEYIKKCNANITIALYNGLLNQHRSNDGKCN